GVFNSQFLDTTAISHEVSEWMDDPLGTNPTPPWGGIGQVPGCMNNLEVADPLTGTGFPNVTMPNGYTYHLQELAFFSWFFGAPSMRAGGLSCAIGPSAPSVGRSSATPSAGWSRWAAMPGWGPSRCQGR